MFITVILEAKHSYITTPKPTEVCPLLPNNGMEFSYMPPRGQQADVNMSVYIVKHQRAHHTALKLDGPVTRELPYLVNKAVINLSTIYLQLLSICGVSGHGKACKHNPTAVHKRMFTGNS
jgi:hypothetical protein